MAETKRRSPVRLVLDLDQTLVSDIELDAALGIAGVLRPMIAARQRKSMLRRRLALLAAAGVVPDAVSGETLLFTRPGVDGFLRAALSRFAAVAVWSKAGADWVELALRTAPLANHRHRLAFVWDGSRCTRLCHRGEGGGLYADPLGSTKPLQKVWRSKRLRRQGWGRTNTVMLDDDPEDQNFVRNSGNGIRMPPFDIAAHVERLVARETGVAAVAVPFDSWLSAFMRYSTHEVLAWADVRPPEKRAWHLRDHPCISQVQAAPPTAKRHQGGDFAAGQPDVIQETCHEAGVESIRHKVPDERDPGGDPVLQQQRPRRVAHRVDR